MFSEKKSTEGGEDAKPNLADGLIIYHRGVRYRGGHTTSPVD